MIVRTTICHICLWTTCVLFLFRTCTPFFFRFSFDIFAGIIRPTECCVRAFRIGFPLCSDSLMLIFLIPLPCRTTGLWSHWHCLHFVILIMPHALHKRDRLAYTEQRHPKVYFPRRKYQIISKRTESTEILRLVNMMTKIRSWLHSVGLHSPSVSSKFVKPIHADNKFISIHFIFTN